MVWHTLFGSDPLDAAEVPDGERKSALMELAARATCSPTFPGKSSMSMLKVRRSVSCDLWRNICWQGSPSEPVGRTGTVCGEVPADPRRKGFPDARIGALREITYKTAIAGDFLEH